MMTNKTFYCLRCQHRFVAEHDPKTVIERSCPACGSNSVRVETPAAVRAKLERQKGDPVDAEAGP